MNNFFVYEYGNRIQFLSTAEPLQALIHFSISTRTEDNSEVPRLIGVWKFKKMKI